MNPNFLLRIEVHNDVSLCCSVQLQACTFLKYYLRPATRSLPAVGNTCRRCRASASRKKIHHRNRKRVVVVLERVRVRLKLKLLYFERIPLAPLCLPQIMAADTCIGMSRRALDWLVCSREEQKSRRVRIGA